MTLLNSFKMAIELGWCIFLLFLLRHFWQSRQVLINARGWLKATGYITQCELVHAGHNVWPKIEYEYLVYEQTLIGHYLFLDTAHNNPNSKYARKIAYDAITAYNSHLEIDVYYNPNRPEESALDVSMPIKLNVILIMISILLVIQASRLGLYFL